MMINIDKIKNEIIERLKPLEPDKIILFGSYAYGTPNEESDIDLFLLKEDLEVDKSREYEIEAHKLLRDLVRRYKIGFDILSAPTSYIKRRKDYFYRVEVLENGKVLYE